MMNRLLTILIFVGFGINLSGQSIVEHLGDYDAYNNPLLYYRGKTIAKGNYDTISINHYETAKIKDNYLVFDKNEGGDWIEFSKISDNLIKVKTGLWQEALIESKIVIREQIYSEGRLIYEVEYDHDGDKLYEKEIDLINQTVRKYRYEDNRLITDRLDSLSRIPIEVANYPNDNLDISDIFLSKEINYFETKQADFRLELYARNNDDQFVINFNDRICSIYMDDELYEMGQIVDIKRGNKIDLSVIVRPTMTRLFTSFPITFLSKFDSKIYDVAVELKGSHINYQNIEIIDEIDFSRDTDEYLVIDQLGTQTSILIASEEHQFTNDTGVFTSCIINLNEIPIGSYDVSIFSCHVGGKFRMNINEN